LMLGDVPINESQGFNFQNITKTIEDFEEPCKFDLVYFDAFAPNKQPEMWDVSIFKKIYNMCSPQARLVTYCAQGQFKRNLKSAGFTVYAAPGPPGKREMTVGVREF
jgi:tRNA U34 5-methylaminomethyl-2-thiouridine-forming methyltransferase MnmC